MLISRKLDGQARVAATVLGNDGAAASIRELIAAIGAAPTIDEVRQTEAVAGGIYFAAWYGLKVTWARRDEDKVPSGWKTFQGRRSAVFAGTSRGATDVLNAGLNWTYRILEADVRLACLAVGLDCGLGVMHADVKGRDSMVLDLMEPLRPVADEFVLSLLARRPVRKAEVVEDARGVVRLRAPLTWDLAQGMAAWRDDVGRLVEEVATLLGRSSPYDVAVPAVLTRSKHRQVSRTWLPGIEPGPVVRTPVTGGTNRRKPRQQPAARAKKPEARCRGCGAVIEPKRGRAVSRFGWCPACLPERRRESATEAQRESRGRTKSHSTAATAKRRSANGDQRLAEQAFELAHEGETFDREWYLREVLPGLRLVSTVTIARTCGMSTSSASKIRRGLRVPHPRYWEALRDLSR
jgi:hypothetical protein